ncbi:MAG: radical enzyme Cfr family [Myxococcales bacterium]|nr:radical enzyme Cfr family [Myxococcales bacterium]
MEADLRSLTPAELATRVKAAGAPAYRGEQVFRWLHEQAVESVDEMTNVPVALRTALVESAPLRPLKTDVVQEARDGTRKLRFRTVDDRAIESVLIPEDPEGNGPGLPNNNDERNRLTLCVSSQVGCAMDCGFCATATLGFGRNLTAGEIVEQVYRATKLAGRRPTNLVFMGMGEPMHNFVELSRALELLQHPWGLHFSPRRITVSTVGIVPGIEKLGALTPPPNLAISLNATTDEVRDRIMPVNRKWPIAALLAAARKFPLAHGRYITFEYVLLAGVNDSDADADRLLRLTKNLRCKVNLIPWNPFSGPAFERPSAERIRAFQERLRASSLPVYIRTPRGDDIDAACGQLAARPSAARSAADDENDALVPLARLERPTPAV